MIELQEIYFKKHGRYAQVPQPGDQKEKLCESIIGTRVDVYEGPQGHGYIVIEIKNKEIRATDYGPEKRSHDWRTNEQ